MLVVPYLRGSLNTTFPYDRIVHARLNTNVRSTKDCLTLRRVTLQSTEDGFIANQPKHQGSGNIDSLSQQTDLHFSNQDNRRSRGTDSSPLIVRDAYEKTVEEDLHLLEVLKIMQPNSSTNVLRKMLTNQRISVDDTIITEQNISS